jgi:hypothetical protein
MRTERMDHFKISKVPYLESNPEPPDLWRNVSTNCATTRPLKQPCAGGNCSVRHLVQSGSVAYPSSVQLPPKDLTPLKNCSESAADHSCHLASKIKKEQSYTP